MRFICILDPKYTSDTVQSAIYSRVSEEHSASIFRVSGDSEL